MLLRKSYRGLPPEGSTVRGRTAAIEGLPGPPHIPPALALGITEEWKVRVPPSWRAAPRPPVSRKQDVGSFRLHRLRVGRGEVLRHGEGIVDMASRGALGRSFGHNGKTGRPGPNASKSRQGSGGGVRLGDAPRKHGEGAGMGDREGGQGE